MVLPTDPALRRRRRAAPTPELVDIVSRDNRRSYDMRRVLDEVFDDTDWLEIQPTFGPAIICALAHLGGHPVAVVANQPTRLAGSIDADAADKAAHFITVADSFHLPIVFLADNPGMLPGSQSERSGVLRSGARMFVAQTTATTLKLHLTLRKAFGFGSMVMSLVGFDNQVATFAYPGATMGRDERGCAQPCLARRCRCRRNPQTDGTRGVLPDGPPLWVRRTDRTRRRPATRYCWPCNADLQPSAGRRTGGSHRHHTVARTR